MRKKRNDWRSQLRNSFHSASGIAGYFGVGLSAAGKKAAEAYPPLVTPYCAGLIDRKNPLNDPILKQFFPSGEEIVREKHFVEDPLHEEKQMPVPGLIHRYVDRAVLLLTNRCPVHCRFCFRKRYWKKGRRMRDISPAELGSAVSYLKKHVEIREVILSGGEPLLFTTAVLRKILKRLSGLPNIEIIRLGTRAPSVLPMRIDRELVKMLSSVKGLWLATHFNHPAELTPESERACGLLVKAGIPVLNQTVLLKGVNDDGAVLEKLFRKLVRMKVKPHYLFSIDPVEGNSHFRVPLEQGLLLMKKLRPRLSSVATPVFAIDLPEGGGKVPLLPDYAHGGQYETIVGKRVAYY